MLVIGPQAGNDASSFLKKASLGIVVILPQESGRATSLLPANTLLPRVATNPQSSGSEVISFCSNTLSGRAVILPQELGTALILLL